MTEITLRAYIREIDNLIEQEKLDEAIAHCRHLLQRHPKYIECYRLLGKAYLEAKRFGDAADIFQRVLSAVPDDFVSHIGMSIVREDEGNLDSAIWHMERAFETNPANPAIQQELKRLIGRRDGFEPQKVRLTRGALARMYAHGELYPQAIAELQSALDEHSDRPDLQVLLAKLLWQTEQRAEAAEVSGELLDILPFCLQATRIMAAVLQHRGKAEEATAYHRRLAQLDPYMAYTEAPMADPVRVDADSIMVQKLSWQPGQPLPSTEEAPADWAASLGLDQDEGTGPGTGPLPSWLDDVEPSEQASPEEVPSAQPFEGAPEPEAMESSGEPEEERAPAQEREPEPEQAAEGGDIPEWMQDAGWQESSGEVAEQPVSFSSEELDQLERGEVPAEEGPSSEETGDLEPAEIPSWLQGMAPGDEEEPDEGDQELEAILRAEAEAAPEPQAEGAAAQEPVGFEEETAEDDEEAAQDVPAWLDEGEPGATSTIMTWLGDRDEEEPSAEALPEASEEELPTPDEAEEEEIPSWLSGVAEAAADSESVEEQELAELRQQASRSQEDLEEPDIESAESGEVPDWLQSIAGGAEEPEEVTDEEMQELSEESELPWEAEVEAAEQDTIPKEDTPQEELEEEVPGWLSGIDEDEQPVAEGPEIEAESPEMEEDEDWLAGLDEEAAEEEEIAEEATWLEELSGEAESDFEAEADTAVPGWMQGLDEDEEPEDEVEARASGWLDDLSDTLAETPAEPTEKEGAIAPDWIDEAEAGEAIQAEPTEEPEAPVAEEAEEDLGWLQDLEDAQAPEVAESQQLPPAADLDDIDEEGVFDWLDQMAAQQEQEQPAAEAEPAEEQAEAEPQVSAEAPPETIDEGLDWLDRLSETRGIDADIEREPAAGTISGRISQESPEEPAAEAEPEPVDTTKRGEWQPEEGLAASEKDEEPQPAAESPEAEEEVPAWLLDQEEPERELPETEDEAPDWLKEQAEPIEQAPRAEEPDTEDEAEAPDWLMAAAEVEEPQPTEPAAPTETEAAEAAPDWLQEQQEPVSEETEPSESVPEVPDWLAAQADSEPEPAPAEQELPAPTEEAPDWLREHGEAADEPAPPPTEEAPAPAAPVPEPEPEQPAVEPQAEAPASDDEEEVPDWLKAQAADVEAEPGEPSEPAEVQAEAAEPAAKAEPEPAPPAPTEVEKEPSAAEPAEAAPAKPEPAEAEPMEAAPPVMEEPTPEPAEAEAVAEEPDAVEAAQSTALEPASEAPRKSGDLASARQALANDEEQRAADLLGAMIKDRRELDDIVEMLETHLEGEPDTPLLWQVLGDAYMRQDRTNKAVQAYDRGMEESEVFDSARQALAGADYERAAAQYGMLIKNKKRLGVVIEDLEKAVEGDKADPRIWQILGDAYMKADRVDESIEAYRKGMDSV